MTNPRDARIPMLDGDDARAAASRVGVPEGMADLSVFKVLLRHEDLAARVNGLLHQLLWNASLDARLRELVIMRIGWRQGSVYEWTQHWRVARLLDVPEHDLLAVRDWQRADHFGPQERAVLAATDDTLRDGTISDATWVACRSAFDDDPAMLVELVAAIGNWRLFSALLRSLDVPLEDGIDAWPPDGTAPDGLRAT